MITTALILTLALQAPRADVLAYSGVPYLAEAQLGQVRVPWHTVSLAVGSDDAKVSSTTVFKNTTSDALKMTLVVPRRGDRPAFKVKGTLGATPLVFAEHPLDNHDLTASITLAPNATAGLRLSYTVPLGRGRDSAKKRLVGYLLDGKEPIGQLNITYRYDSSTVFRLPDMSPSLGWQTGSSGSFLRLSKHEPYQALTIARFYPGGFDNIGD